MQLQLKAEQRTLNEFQDTCAYLAGADVGGKKTKADIADTVSRKKLMQILDDDQDDDFQPIE